MNHEGIGLGLTIVKQIVEKNGGYIGVHSLGTDQGSSFFFSMEMELYLDFSLEFYEKCDASRSSSELDALELSQSVDNVHSATHFNSFRNIYDLSE